MAGNVNKVLKRTLVTEWRQVKDSMSQADFVARASDRHGVKLTARTLRSWCRDLDLARPAQQLERLRRLVSDALVRVRIVEAELEALLANLEPGEAAAPFTPSTYERQPLSGSAAKNPVERADTIGGAPQLDPNPRSPATPPSMDAPDSTVGSLEFPKKFVWDLDA